MAYETETKRYDDLYNEYAAKVNADKEKAKKRTEEDYNENFI